jgi:hypothetical protein
MTASARSVRAAEAESRPRELSDATVKAAGGWISQFARTLKTCRLYDAGNPTVVRFRDELGAAATALTGEHGPITYRFEADDVTCDGQSLHPARSRDDNFAYPFHRDGVRGFTLQPGVDPREVGTLVDSVLAVTGANLDADDLVTLLWEANLPHVDIDFIPAQGDVGGDPAAQGGGDPAASLLPWPEPDPDDEAKPGDAVAPATGGDRSEDWLLGGLTVEVEAAFVELDALASVEVGRFLREFTEEHLVSPIRAALAIATACLNANATDEDRQELARFLPRVLRGALSVGAWPEALESLRAIRGLRPPQWSEETFVQELMQPVSIARVVERLDEQEPDEIAAYLALSLEVGDAGLDWITLALCESQRRVTRQLLAEFIAERCRDNPERLAPWLADGRWYVVRNIVHILGWIGGPPIVGLLQVALRNPDTRVRTQVVASLSQVELRLARPLLIRALDGAEPRLFCTVLGQLSAARDPATARFVYAFTQHERFAQRSPEERRAVYAAIASVGGDELVPELEAELLKGNWFDRETEIHRHNIARCLVRIGTPTARAVLERATQSKRTPVRQAAQMALASLGGAA